MACGVHAMNLHRAQPVRHSFGSCYLHKAQAAPLRQCAVRAKKDIHPQYFEESKVVCNGEEVLTTSGTQSEYHVDIWSGNHPFYQGAGSAAKQPEGRVHAFNKRFQGLEDSMGKAGAGGGAALKYEGAKKPQKKKGKK